MSTEENDLPSIPPDEDPRVELKKLHDCFSEARRLFGRKTVWMGEDIEDIISTASKKLDALMLDIDQRVAVLTPMRLDSVMHFGENCLEVRIRVPGDALQFAYNPGEVLDARIMAAYRDLRSKALGGIRRGR